MEPTKESIQAVLGRKDHVGMHAIGRALVHLFDRQTAYEQNAEMTTEANGVGFTAFDGEIGASMAKYYKRHGKLTPGQVAVWQKTRKNSTVTKIGKYAGQLLPIAQEKQGLKNCTIKADADPMMDHIDLQPGSWPLTLLKRKKEIFKWCKKNIGVYTVDWFYYENRFYFKDEQSNTLFSLTWAGV